MDKLILKDIHILKLNILGCDRTIPLNRISSRDSQRLVAKRRDRAKGLHQGDKHDIKAGAGEKREFGFVSSSLAFDLIEQKALTRGSPRSGDRETNKQQPSNKK